MNDERKGFLFFNMRNCYETLFGEHDEEFLE